mmetsp:Transcript_5565/g.25068  ORF Transcript_5565/g.25068 Transcript_5565/m.25068 type:complete len:212 (-) Transcript_5565:441-1076(-)
MSRSTGKVTARRILAFWPVASDGSFAPGIFQKNRTICTLSHGGSLHTRLFPLNNAPPYSRSSSKATLNPSDRWLTLMVMLHLKLYSFFTSSRVSPVDSFFSDIFSWSPKRSSMAGTSRHSVCRMELQHSSASCWEYTPPWPTCANCGKSWRSNARKRKGVTAALEVLISLKRSLVALARAVPPPGAGAVAGVPPPAAVGPSSRMVRSSGTA